MRQPSGSPSTRRIKSAISFDLCGRRLSEAAVDVGTIARDYDLAFLGLVRERRPTPTCKRFPGLAKADLDPGVPVVVSRNLPLETETDECGPLDHKPDGSHRIRCAEDRSGGDQE